MDSVQKGELHLEHVSLLQWCINHLALDPLAIIVQNEDSMYSG